MVRSRFPGKPSKLLSRKKVSSYTEQGDADGFNVAEDTQIRLAVFNSLFPDSDEDSSFHGFSPHKQGPPKLRPPQTSTRMSPAVKTKNKSARESVGTPKSEKSPASPPSTPKTSTPSDEKQPKKSDTAAAGFVLPTRSAHSSRVIKPNKRFFESDPIDVVPSKKPRLNRDDCSSDVDRPSVVADESNAESDADGVASDKEDNSSPTAKAHPSEDHGSPTKFVLRKPTLNITSQPFSTVESRFSTSGNAVFKDSNSRHATKVVCGVCGIMKSYRYIGQARKFGIHSCDHCRRFIVRMIRMEREKTLEQLNCVSGTGNCPVRQSSLAVCKSFSVEEPSVNKADKDISNRCKGCWLNLCLRSFKLPDEVSNRLATYLPRELSKSSSNLSANWGELERICGDKLPSNKPNQSESSRKKKARNDVCAIKIKGKQKNASGPRVKHVCRSASLVLGQPVATFDGPLNKSPSDVHVSNEIERKPCSTDVALVPLPSNEKPKKEEVVLDEIFRERSSDVPIARMLQDLGRDNCDLLDGIERYDVVKKLAKVSIDFWESYDPEEVSQTGFSLIGFNPLTFRPLCYICGSAGLEKLIHCVNCCEPYHTFCVSSLRFETTKKEWWKVDWLCPKCTVCEVCSKTGSGQIGCSKCFKSYHTSCLPSGRANISDCNWVCPSCLECKSCKDSSVHMLVGNIPLCKNCFKLRKKGNYCPLCQGCYDDNDYDTKMMECAECSHWIHAKCEKLSDEKYQFLSYLPATIEFVCSQCCQNRPAFWMTAVSDQLKTGCLNVIKTLSKNKTLCTVVKASPVKLPKCSCQDSRSKPIMLKNLNSHFDAERHSPEDSTLASTPTDLGLLTPKLTKDDEASLETVKSGLLSLVKDGRVEASKLPIYDFHEDEYDPTLTLNRSGGRLLSILDGNRSRMSEPVDKSEPVEIKCNCSLLNGTQPLTLMDIKKKSSTGEYSSVFEFNKDMEKVIKDISDDGLLNFYHETLKQAFPWFDPNEEDVHDTSSHNIDSINESKTMRKSFESDYSLSPRKIAPAKPAFTALLDRDPKYYYIGVTPQDLRMCMLCKGTGEGDPRVEGRLLYCGQNEWVHANCALWSSEVFEEIDGSLQNVQSAISRARLIRCSGCGNKGASVGCCARSCPSAYHFSCARKAECVFLDSKEVYCKAHGHCRGNKELHKEENYLLSRSIYVELDHKKKKDVLVSDVRLCVGSLMVDCFGEIISEFSDLKDFVLPNNFQCGRLFWSTKEPWKLVRYNIHAKVVFPVQDLARDYETNYTINHASLETPPPSPGDDKFAGFSACESDVAAVLNHLVDVCSRDEENLADQQTTDLLLPPDIKDALFEDLPHDLLDGISMHDIFTKMNFDEALLSDPKEEVAVDRKEESKVKYKKNLGIYYKPVSSKRGEDRRDCSKWKRSEIIQVDGAVDFSESEMSNDSCDVQMTSGCDSPVKCGRCRRTYRSNIGFERHLPTCSDDLSESESESEDEIGVSGTYYKTIETNCKVETTCIETVLKPVETICNGVNNVGSFGGYEGVPVESMPQETYVTNLIEPVMDVQSPTIILQQMPVEPPAPSYVQTFSQPAQTTYAQQTPTNIQYIVNSEKQFLTPSMNGGYHIQSAPVVPNVSPTVVGTIINSNGIDQIVLNNTVPGIEMYAPQQNNVLITNTPMIVGMETVVSNTVMSSSQFISGSVPGMLASSYSATTTQVFHKPTVIDVPQSYVVVDTSPVVSNVPCVVRSSPSSHPWNNYQTTYQESYKVNKNVSYQTVTRQTRETIFIEPFSGKSETRPSSEVRPNGDMKETPVKVKPALSKLVNGSKSVNPGKAQSPKVNQAKLVELPHSSAVHKEKPQQAVAPVVVKQLPAVNVMNQPLENVETKKTPTSCDGPVSTNESVPPENECRASEPSPSINSTVDPPNSIPKPLVQRTYSYKAGKPLNPPKVSLPKSVEKEVPKVETQVKPPPPVPPPPPPLPTLQTANQSEEPKMTFEIISEDGLSFSTSSLEDAWKTIFDSVQKARQAKGLPLLTKNPFSSPEAMLSKLLGMGNNSVKYILEQLPGISGCTNFKPVYHKKKPTALEQELARKTKENKSGCARTEKFEHAHIKYDMFSWLASRHRRPPKFLLSDTDGLSGNRRATSTNLPMAMRFRHLKETSKVAVGVFRSDIHGRGLFCLRDIDSGEMVIEYAGEVIRSALTDKRERYYTARGIGCYMFRIDDKFVVDATMKGNAARFINHSCEPNCYSKVVDILGKKHILIFALRKIIQGEELTYDYKFPLEEEKISCHCLSRRCRKYLN